MGRRTTNLGLFKADPEDGWDSMVPNLDILDWSQLGLTNVKSAFGAKGDNVTDDTAAIQAAIDSLSATGGRVYFPKGRYVITGTIRVKSDATWLEGETYQPRIFGGSFSKGSILRWAGATGAGPMVDFAADTSSTAAILGGGMLNMGLNGNSSIGAQVGLSVRTIWHAEFRNVHIHECSDAMLDLNDYSSGFSGGQNNVYACGFYNMSMYSFAMAGVGIRSRGSTSQGGPTLCSFYNTMIDTKNGHGMDLSNCDDLHFFGTTLSNAGGTGHSIELRGKNVGSGWNKRASSCTFHGLYPGSGGIFCRAGDGSQPAINNLFVGLSFEDGVEPEVTVESGATAIVVDLRGKYNILPKTVLATGTGKTVDNVITVLQNLGLCSQT